MVILGECHYSEFYKTGYHKKYFLTKMSLQSILNLIISEAVDEWVQHGDHNHVEHRHHLVLVSGEAGLGHHINECYGPIEQSDCSEVGSAGGEGLLPESYW